MTFWDPQNIDPWPTSGPLPPFEYPSSQQSYWEENFTLSDRVVSVDEIFHYWSGGENKVLVPPVQSSDWCSAQLEYDSVCFCSGLRLKHTFPDVLRCSGSDLEIIKNALFFSNKPIQDCWNADFTFWFLSQRCWSFPPGWTMEWTTVRSSGVQFQVFYASTG